MIDLLHLLVKTVAHWFSGESNAKLALQYVDLFQAYARSLVYL